jgi:hypothetical protein
MEGLRRMISQAKNKANMTVHQTTMPSALLARRLRSSLGFQKQVVAGDFGRSEIYNLGT